MPYSVKIVVLDYYMSQPIPGLDVTYSEFRSTTINQVPVLRCFGSNENGQKICVHVHGVFPYLYIPYDGKGKPEELMYKLAISIDKTINIQFNQASSNAHHVYKISLVSGIPMYGYHAKKHQFFKIYLYNPNLVPKVGALFLNKNILEQVFQPHEIHLNFTLQFMIDYNLHGMSNMLLGNIKFRYNPDCSGNDIDKDLFLPHSVSKTSMCELEADILAENILNREEIISGNLAVNPGIAALWEDEKQRRRNKSEVSQLGDFLELKNMNVPPTKTHQVFQQALKERLAVLSTDKEVAKQPSPDASIYPAEVSDNLDIQNASCLDIHCSSSLELSLDDTFISNSQFLNISLPADEDTDKEAQEFMLILEQLAEEKIGEVEQEEGSMLSQCLPDEQSNEIAEDDLDLSMPLASLTTPVKSYVAPIENKSDDEPDDYLNTTLIPQVDGQHDSDDSDSENWVKKSVKRVAERKEVFEQFSTPSKPLGKSMPSLLDATTTDESPLLEKPLDKLDLIPYVKLPKVVPVIKIRPANIEKYIASYNQRLQKNESYRRSPEAARNDKIRLLKFRLDKFENRRKLHKVGKVIKRSASRLINVGSKPKFRVIPAIRHFLGIDESIQKRKATNSLLGNNIYINCDGANASSSDDEEQTSSKAKSLRKKMRSSPYPALAISVVNTPKPMAKSSIGNGENYVPMPGEHKHCHGAQQPVKVSHKRKLFPPQNLNTSTTTLSSTTTEEFLSCAYSSKPVAISYVKVQESSQSYDFPESDSDLFSDNDHNNLTVAEKYDLYSNFHAKEGCSTVITPHSSSLNSGHSSNIPPYQPDKSISSLKAPSRARVEATLCDYKIPKSRNQEPFYGNPGDYTGLVEIGQRTMRIASKTTIHLPNFDSKFNALEEYRKHFIENVAKLKWNTNNVKSMKLAHCANKSVILCPVKSAPSAKRVKEWLVNHAVSSASPEPPAEEYAKVCYSPLNDTSDFEFSLTPVTSSVENPLSSVIIEHKKRNSASNESCQIRGPTQNNTFGFDRSVQDLHAVRAVENHQYLTTMVMELHIRTRGELKPDPQLDEICAIFFSFLNDVPETSPKKCSSRGVIALNCLPVDLSSARADFLDGLGIDCDIIYVDTEQALIHSLVELVRKWDPDIFTGYEIEMLSWGYLIERAFVLSINLMSLLGRSELHKYGKSKLKHQEFETNIIGRVVINVWRIMRHEIALQSYTFESVVYHILHRRIPLHPFKELTFWWDHRSNIYRHRSVRYYLLRVDTVLELFHKLDFMNRTSELARLFGIMFYEVLSRGSQFRVESMMLRLAKPLNFVPVSPDTKQRAHMKAPEYIPLVMEPESKLYTDPVIVLDFQSLYPSMMIAYNYCFTTCLGRVGNLGTNQPFEFGANQLKVPRKLVEKLCKRELLNYSPCGVCFVKQKVREGILPRMLKEVLDTRLMVKNSMKENKGNANLQKVLHNRQLGLKLIANVTYGYTAANFSGRMCCVEVGDSVVSKGRETLQRAIALVENNKEWCAKVVYGDTDSLFVLVPNRSKEEAFEIGKQIADTVTADNPDPVKLKLEKVYQPCILQTKKRYVGYMYESPDDKVPVYEAKGIETVRRDGCPAVSKMLQKCLSLLFETKDVSIIKSYVLKQFSKILAGRASIQDLTFAKEYRGRNGYRPGACVPALELTRKWTSLDPRNEPRSGERVPYVIVNGPPGLPLIRLVRSPRDLLNDSSLRPNALYYITKVIIPPLNRCFNLIGADVNIWFNQMPRKNTQYLPNSSPTIKTTISQYFLSKLCASCSLPTPDGLCQKCTGKPHKTVLVLTEKLKKWEENYNNALLICQSCTGSVDQLNCASLDCPVLYRKTQTFNDLQQSAYVRELLDTSPIFAQTTYFDT